MSVKIKSRLPKGHRDGLQHLTDRLRNEPGTQLAVVMLCSPSAITENLDDDDDPYTVTLAVDAIEVPEGIEAGAVVSMLSATYERRTGRQPLPFGTVLDWEPGPTATPPPPPDVDPSTGEINPGGDE